MPPTDSPARVPRVDAAGRVRMVPTPAGWRGVRVSTQAEADARIPLLLGDPAEVRFVWVEPVEAVDLRSVPNINPDRCRYFDNVPSLPSMGKDYPARKIDWLIVSGQCGPTARPMHPDWVRSLRDQAKAAWVPFCFVGWGEYVPYEHDAQPPFLTSQHGDTIDGHLLPHNLTDRVGEVLPGGWMMDDHCDLYRRVGKRAAGRLLDGVTNDVTPQPTKGGTK